MKRGRVELTAKQHSAAGVGRPWRQLIDRRAGRVDRVALEQDVTSQL